MATKLFVCLVFVFVVSLGLLLPRPEVASGSHAEYHAGGWDPYFLGSTPKRVDWTHCIMSSYEWNIAGIAFNNWTYRFSQGTSHNHQGSSCTWPPPAGREMVVMAMTPSNMDIYCGPLSPPICIATSTSGETYNSVCNCFVAHTERARIIFNYVYFGQLYNPYKEMHLFAHEFGHAMGLAHHPPCGASVMSPAGCEDLVHPWPGTPNDVCTPDNVFGYGTNRC